MCNLLVSNFQTSMNARYATGTGRAKEFVTTLTALTTAAVTICLERSWLLTDMRARISTSAGRTMEAVLTLVSTRWALIFAPVPKDTCWATTGKLATVRLSSTTLYIIHGPFFYFLLFQTLTNAITIPTMTRIDCVLECVAIRSDHTSAWIRTRSQSHAKLDSNFTTKTANAKVSGVFLSLSSTCPSFPVVVADIDECASTSNGGCSHKCINTEGSHRCECPVGLFLETDNTTCQGLCVNTATEQQVSNWRCYIVQI